MVEIEDGTAVVHVRLSEQITRRLFGVEAREFKKIFQANPDRAMAIQARSFRDFVIHFHCFCVPRLPLWNSIDMAYYCLKEQFENLDSSAVRACLANPGVPSPGCCLVLTGQNDG